MAARARECMQAKAAVLLRGGYIPLAVQVCCRLLEPVFVSGCDDNSAPAGYELLGNGFADPSASPRDNANMALEQIPPENGFPLWSRDVSCSGS